MTSWSPVIAPLNFQALERQGGGNGTSRVWQWVSYGAPLRLVTSACATVDPSTA
jgi:hypothetical protein